MAKFKTEFKKTIQKILKKKLQLGQLGQKMCLPVFFSSKLLSLFRGLKPKKRNPNSYPNSKIRNPNPKIRNPKPIKSKVQTFSNFILTPTCPDSTMLINTIVNHANIIISNTSTIINDDNISDITTVNIDNKIISNEYTTLTSVEKDKSAKKNLVLTV